MKQKWGGPGSDLWKQSGATRVIHAEAVCRFLTPGQVFLLVNLLQPQEFQSYRAAVQIRLNFIICFNNRCKAWNLWWDASSLFLMTSLPSVSTRGNYKRGSSCHATALSQLCRCLSLLSKQWRFVLIRSEYKLTRTNLMLAWRNAKFIKNFQRLRFNH